MSAHSGQLDSAGVSRLGRPCLARDSNGREAVVVPGGARGTPAPSVLAGRRLGLGIVNVGFWVLAA
ncbi:MAG: hypothetical protein ACKOET_11335, partial [Verrucomicrobiota bacterium]